MSDMQRSLFEQPTGDAIPTTSMSRGTKIALVIGATLSLIILGICGSFGYIVYQRITPTVPSETLADGFDSHGTSAAVAVVSPAAEKRAMVGVPVG